MCNLAALFTSISPAAASCPVVWGLSVDLRLQFMVLMWTLLVAGMPVMDQPSSRNTWSTVWSKHHLLEQPRCEPTSLQPRLPLLSQSRGNRPAWRDGSWLLSSTTARDCPMHPIAV